MSKEAMKLALVALEDHGHAWARHEVQYSNAITALREAMAAPVQQQEPARGYIGDDCDPSLSDDLKVFCPACCTKFQAIPINVQKLMLDAGFKPPFRTAPTQRKPLTEEQIVAICAPLGFAQLSPYDVARAIEAAHGIKS